MTSSFISNSLGSEDLNSNRVAVVTENTNEEQVVSRLSTLLRGKTGIAVFLLVSASVVLVSLLLAFSRMPNSCNTKEKEDCSNQSKLALLGKICGGVFVLIFFVSGAAVIACNKRHRKQSSTDVVVSAIPTEDLEKSPAPMLPYNHIPHHTAFGRFGEGFSADLPDYSTAILNVHEVSPNLSERFWMEEIDANSNDETDPPPCYEQALKMSGLCKVAADRGP